MIVDQQSAGSPARSGAFSIKTEMKSGGRFVPRSDVFGSRSNEKSFDTVKVSFDRRSVYDNSMPRGTPRQLVAEGCTAQ
jgi:hypothetical protein